MRAEYSLIQCADSSLESDAFCGSLLDELLIAWDDWGCGKAVAIN
jgi:hypothetical protein